MVTGPATAKRGDVLVMEFESHFTYLHGQSTRHVSYDVGIITSVTRDGRAKLVDMGHGVWARGPFASPSWVVSQAMLDMPAFREALQGPRYPHVPGTQPLETLDAARAFVRQFTR